MSERRRCDPAWPSHVVQWSERGAVAFSRSGDPNIGEFDDAVILKTFGQVPEDFADSQRA
jgi:hypothetical protein